MSARATTLGELLRDCEGAALHGCDASTRFDALVSDSRKAKTGDVFVALAGGAHDGHRFVADVLARGAAAVIVQRDRNVQIDGPHVVVDDTWAALPILAAHAHGDPGDALRLAGVTGTNGKTTTAHLVGAILRAAGRAHARLGTTGNWMVDHEDRAGFTTPFPIELQALLADARARGATDVVMEVSSHALAQDRVAPLRYHAVGLTSFSQDHLDFHPDMAAYLAAKCRLASTYLRTDGIAVAAVDGQPAAAEFLAAARGTRWRASRGGDPRAEIRAEAIDFAAAHTRARIETPMGAIDLRSPLVGPFYLDNSMVAIGLALGLGVDLAAIADALAHSHGAPGRLEPVAVDGVAGPQVLVDYAHTPDAVERTLAVLRPLARGRLAVVLGCGGDRDPGKRPQMGAIAGRDADVFYATSDNPRSEPPEQIVDQMIAGVAAAHADRVVREVDRARAIARAIAAADASDIVLIAGKGHEDYQEIAGRRHHFDDREHARAALALRAP
ncbi:MAG TPA: UDP-N-acetylmuramoyl-L-alanyl-D-glutamate--2,6-diaminopimelate ligase [Nannocystaceae bacterium]|nr:UDP-N-acetylmuramoyl-L-alanyl-D-glutamate--2,6-diaminopimelate ligase [Nannocystaceae bacterium]